MGRGLNTCSCVRIIVRGRSGVGQAKRRPDDTTRERYDFLSVHKCPSDLSTVALKDDALRSVSETYNRCQYFIFVQV